MSNFFSLDDEDDAVAGPSNQGSQLQEELSNLSPPSSSARRGQTSSSSSNPIYALLDDGSRGETSRIQESNTDLNFAAENSGKLQTETPILQLQRAWISERAAPELLSWRGNAVDDVCSQIEEQMVSHLITPSGASPDLNALFRPLSSLSHQKLPLPRKSIYDWVWWSST
jgi:hypothetical protein